MSNNARWTVLPERKPGRWVKLDGAWFDTAMNRWLDEVQLWCQENKCGRRMSYDMWQFDTNEQVTAFLLKWA